MKASFQTAADARKMSDTDLLIRAHRVATVSAFPSDAPDGLEVYHSGYKERFTRSDDDSGWLGTRPFYMHGTLPASAGGTYMRMDSGSVNYSSTNGHHLPWKSKVKEMAFYYGGTAALTVSVIANDSAVTGASISVSVLDNNVTETLMTSGTINAESALGLKITSGTQVQVAIAHATLFRFETS